MTYEVVTAGENLAFDADYSLIKNTITELMSSVNSIVIDGEDAFKSVTSYYRKARDWKKIIEEKRKIATEPFRKQQVLINDKAKELTDPLTKVEQIAKLKADEYQKRLEELKRQEDERIKAAAVMLDIPEETVYLAPVAPTIRGDGAMAYTVTEKRFKVTDIEKVPAKYLLLNEATIKQDLKLGIMEIPGLEIYEEKITRLRTR